MHQRGPFFSCSHVDVLPFLSLCVYMGRRGGAIETAGGEVVLLLDRSCSMQDGSLADARTAAALALRLVGEAKAPTYFNLMQFGSVAATLFPQSVPATAATLAAAHTLLQQGKRTCVYVCVCVHVCVCVCMSA
jgi:hypothetical protein